MFCGTGLVPPDLGYFYVSITFLLVSLMQLAMLPLALVLVLALITRGDGCACMQLYSPCNQLAHSAVSVHRHSPVRGPEAAGAEEGTRKQRLRVHCATKIVDQVCSYPNHQPRAADDVEVPAGRFGHIELRPLWEGALCRLSHVFFPQLTHTRRAISFFQYSGDDSSWGYLAGSNQYTDGWQHIACRTYDLSKDEFRPDRRDSVNTNNAGVVTNVHLCDLGIEGELATSAFRRAEGSRASCDLS